MVDDIRRWLVERVADYLDRDAAEVDADAKFADLGLDSVYSMILCGDVEERYGLEVEPTITWDHPTVALLAGHLSGELAAR
ncbi:acyl carrier protein [Spirillospora sp. NPDC047279]|uniref:acyl carrier protein n=1 Tax=Spirillospora sp. NPDC047279 TaxID=3155478 RepID=UPI0033E22B82